MSNAGINCGEAVIALLEERGVELVFGIPGVHTVELYRGLARSQIRHVGACHEQGAAFMADGYARVSGRPGVCLLITGPGVTNAATAVASAYHDSQPLLVIASETARADAGRSRGTLHDLPDQRALMAGITAYSETVSQPVELTGALGRAFAVLEGPRPRPAYVGIPIDVLDEPFAMPAGCGPPPVASGPEHASRVVAENSIATADGLARACELLSGSQRPMILLGGGAIDAGEPALSISAATGAPIVTTINGKGAVPEDDPVVVGATTAFQPVFGELEQADVVLAAGTEFSELDHHQTQHPPRFNGDLIRIDADAAQLRSGAEPAVALAGDAGELLQRLSDDLPYRDLRTRAAERAAPLRKGLQWWPGAERFFPVLDAIRHGLPPDTIIAADSTQLAYVANYYMHINRSRSYLCPAGYGTLGPALPMAIGASLAAPGRPVLSLIGDGGLLFTVAELATAAQLRLPLPIVLWNNRGYGEIRDAMTQSGVSPIGTDKTALDFQKVAEGFGCRAVRAATLEQVGPALSAALTANAPTLIEVPAADLLG